MVDDDSRGCSASSTGAGDMKSEPLPPVEDSEQLAGRSVAEKGTGPACEHGGQPSPFSGDLPMADREDATVDAVKVPVVNEPRDLRRAQPSRGELEAGHDPVLTGGQPGHWM